MHLHVGPFVYQVKTVSGYITYQGQRCLGLCDNDRHELLISDQSSSAQQIQVICHEYMEAWLYHFAQSSLDKEAYCDLFGLAMTQFLIDLAQSLDEAALPDHRSLFGHIAALARGVRQASSYSPAKPHRAVAPKRQSPGGKRGTHGTDQRSAVTAFKVTDYVEPARPGSARPWHIRVFEPSARR